MREVDKVSFGFPLTSKDDPRTMNGKPTRDTMIDIPQT